MIRRDFLQQQQPEEEQDRASTHVSTEQNYSYIIGHRGGADIYELGLYDVICGRHKAAFNNVGNRRFRVTVSLALERYSTAPTRKDKSTVIKSVADLVRGNGGRFLKWKQGAWVVLNEKQTHEKVGHALRDATTTKAASDAASSSASSKTVKSTFRPTAHTSADPSASTSMPQQPNHPQQPLPIELGPMPALLVSHVFAAMPKRTGESSSSTSEDAEMPTAQSAMKDDHAQEFDDSQVDGVKDSQLKAHRRESSASSDSDILDWLSVESEILLDNFEN